MMNINNFIDDDVRASSQYNCSQQTLAGASAAQDAVHYDLITSQCTVNILYTDLAKT